MAHSAENNQDIYYVPHEGSLWPAIAIVGMFGTTVGASMMMNESSLGAPLMYAGIAVLLFMFYGWIKQVAGESMSGLYNKRMDLSFRWSMGWFIFSEVMFFAAFFGALWYARAISIPFIGGEGNNLATNLFLWDGWEAHWPTNGPAEWGGIFQTVAPWGEWGHGFKEWFNHSLPLVNTMILLTSGVTLEWAHHRLLQGKNGRAAIMLGVTSALGVWFLYLQASEYAHAYADLNLTLESGIYGSTFYMLTGFHGMHVTLGTIMLIVITIRTAMGHFSKEQHFGFEGVAWYWHFVDVVWLGLFIFVYIL
ncbi:MAG: cytochrome c oxidase subunit 3 [Gammaproteobacteria bacterium]|nr:cytochrome c oxidase subunit 3 [Gammaproteobacteria bacterium]